MSLLSNTDDAASRLTIASSSANLSHTRTSRIDVSDYPPVKRRKVDGLNMRFDRMIKSVNTMLSCRNSYPTSSRKRVQSSSTSSVSSYGVPRTPVDVCSDICSGKLGRDFSVLKMKNPLLREYWDGCSKPAVPLKEPKSSLPDWLANTFCNLEAGHPLRGLLSPSHFNTKYKSNAPPVELLDALDEEEVFAFSPSDPDKQVAPSTAYHADCMSNIERAPPVIPVEPIILNLRLGVPANAPPFSTPGCLASVRKSNTDGISQKPLVSQQVTLHTANMKRPAASLPSHLRSDDAIENSQIANVFSNLAQDDDPPFDVHEHAYIDHTAQVPGGGDDSFNVYATPGPTFAFSRPVYFDSPTEDPSFSDPLLPESYELDLNGIDFHWRPFLRSNLQERCSSRRPVLPSSLLGYSVPNPAGDQSGLNTRFTVDQEKCSASREEFPSLAEDVEVAYLSNTTQHSNVIMTGLGATTNRIGSCSSLINDVLRSVSAPTPDSLLSPLPNSALFVADGVRPRGDGEDMYTSETLTLVSEREPNLQVRHVCDLLSVWHRCSKLRSKESSSIGPEVRGMWPSTPPRQLPVSPPSAPQKTRSNQLYRPQPPTRKMSSALSWMVPLMPSRRAIAPENGANFRLSHVSADMDSHDSIESWGESQGL